MDIFENQIVPIVDGQYYLIQVRSMLTNGGLVYGDPPLTFYLLSFFSLLFGDIIGLALQGSVVVLSELI
jgi:hypothetical protein